MGLDITAYAGLKPVQVAVDSDGEPIDEGGYFRAYVNPDFPGREDGIEHHTFYSFADKLSFRAGSYSGYNEWRRQLAVMAGWPNGDLRDAIEWDFYELIWFADNEGTIGPVVSAKLAKDFVEFQPVADRIPDDYFREKYALWRKAFEMAQRNGAVSFH